MKALDALTAARERLALPTPLKRDCGKICGGACCQSDEDGQGGMLLFPGEDKLYDPLPPGFRIEKCDQVIPDGHILYCEGECERDRRPLACRLFPLLPTREGTALLDQRAWAVCPLMDSGVRGLDPAFVQAVREAGSLLYQSPEHARFLDALHAFNRRLTQW